MTSQMMDDSLLRAADIPGAERVVLSVPAPEPTSTFKPVWNLAELYKVPKVYPAEDFAGQAEREGVRAIFFEGLPFKGKPTRVFAWYGVPKDIPKDKKIPAMVLVHGGAGTAYIDWVKLWISRGYAAIVVDNCGQIPVPVDPSDGKKGWKRHAMGGPAGWGGFDQTDWPLEDQWSYHAVADVILAHSLIRSFPEVDAEKIGITGISWGGYLTCIAASVDSRFKFAVPVYGCGFLGENSAWMPIFSKMGKERALKWLRQWDPNQYLPYIQMPMLWVTGTNDFAFPMDSLQKSYRLPKTERVLSVRIRMPHGHGGPGENPPEILTFAESILNHGVPLPICTEQGVKNATDQQDGVLTAWVSYQSQSPVARAEFAYTTDDGQWKTRQWVTQRATIDQTNHRVEAKVPANTKVYYFILHDARGQLVSSEHVVLNVNNR